MTKFQIGLLAFVAIATSCVSATVDAATLVVCNSPRCYNTIQEAIDAASPDDTILVNEPVHTEAGIAVNKNLTIQGLGKENTIVQAGTESPLDGNHTDPGFPMDRVFWVPKGVQAAISDMTIRHGNAKKRGGEVGDGGGIFNEGHLTLNNTIITKNRGLDGGGVSNGRHRKWDRLLRASSTLVIRKSQIENNTAVDNGGGIANRWGRVEILDKSEINDNTANDDGGGISNSHGEVIIEQAEIKNNFALGFLNLRKGLGGGIVSELGYLQITQGSFSENRAGFQETQSENGYGGAINLFQNETDINLSTFTANRARGGGAIAVVGGTLAIVDSTFQSNVAHEKVFGSRSGSALFSTANAVADVRRSTFSGNEGKYAIANNGKLLGLYNSTVSSNSRSGVVNDEDGTLEVINSTITLHRGLAENGIWNAGGTTRVSNSVVAQNSRDCQGPIVAVNPNLESRGTCGFSIRGDANLGPLAKNRGAATETHALLLGSAAINAGANPVCAANPINGEDQTKYARPQPEGGNCDLGAYEAEFGIREEALLSLRFFGEGSIDVSSPLGPCEFEGANPPAGDCEGEIETGQNSVTATPREGSSVGSIEPCDEILEDDDGSKTCLRNVQLDETWTVTIEAVKVPKLVIEGDDAGTGSGWIDCEIPDECRSFDLSCDISPGGKTDPAPCQGSLEEWDGLPVVVTAYAEEDSIIADWVQGCDVNDAGTWISLDRKYAKCVVSIDPVHIQAAVTIRIDLVPPPPPPPPPEDAPTVVADTDDPEVADPAGEFRDIGDISKLDELIGAISQWFDQSSNLFQRLILLDSDTGEISTLRQTGDLDADGEIRGIDEVDVFRHGITVARVFKMAGDGSDFENLDAHYDPPDVVPFSTIVGHGTSVAPPLRASLQSTGRQSVKGVGDSTVESIGKFASNDPHFVVQVSYMGEGDAMISADLDNVPIPLVELFRAGDAVGDGFTFDSFEPGAVPGIALNPNGDGAVVADVIDPGSGLAVDGLLTFRADTPGAGLLLHGGEATEMPGVIVTRVVNVSMDAAGVIAVLGRVGGTGISSSNDEAVWACIAGLCSIAVQEGMEPDGMPGVRLRFPGSPVVHGGMLLMRTVLEGTGIDNTNNFGLLLVDLGTGAINLVSQKGDAFAGGTISEFVAKAFSNDIPLVLVRLSTFAHALARVGGAGLVPLIQPGDQFELPDGTMGTVSSVGGLTETGGEDGRRSAVGGGGYAIVVSFEDGRQGIVACTAACLEGGP